MSSEAAATEDVLGIELPWAGIAAPAGGVAGRPSIGAVSDAAPPTRMEEIRRCRLNEDARGAECGRSEVAVAKGAALISLAAVENESVLVDSARSDNESVLVAEINSGAIEAFCTGSANRRICKTTRKRVERNHEIQIKTCVSAMFFTHAIVTSVAEIIPRAHQSLHPSWHWQVVSPSTKTEPQSCDLFDCAAMQWASWLAAATAAPCDPPSRRAAALWPSWRHARAGATRGGAHARTMRAEVAVLETHWPPHLPPQTADTQTRCICRHDSNADTDRCFRGVWESPFRQ